MLVRTLKFASGLPHQDDSAEGAHGRKRGLGVYHSLLGGRGRSVAVKEGGGLVGGTCEHCEDRAPSGPRQDSVRTLSGLCQDSVRTLSGLCQDCQDSCGSSTNQVGGPWVLGWVFRHCGVGTPIDPHDLLRSLRWTPVGVGPQPGYTRRLGKQ